MDNMNNSIVIDNPPKKVLDLVIDSEREGRKAKTSS